MSILWMDGFEHYGSGTTGKNNMTIYGVYNDAGASSISTTRVRTGTYSCSNPEIVRNFGGNLSTVGVGCALWLDQNPGSPTLISLFRFRDSNNYVLIEIGISNTWEIVLYRGPNNDEVARSSPGMLTTGAWYHWEVKFSPNGATSAIEIRINEETVYVNNSFPIGSPSGSMQGATSTSCSLVAFYCRLTSGVYMDDLYAWDTNGSYNNDWIGDKRVATMFPNGDTAEADWTPNSGGTGYTQIDDLAPDGDTTYVTTSTVGAMSEYDFEPMPTNATGITAVQIYTAARKTDTGTCDIRTDIVSGAYSSAGATQVCTTAYVYKQKVFETDPNTGALWTKAGVDAAKIRIEREA